VFTVYGGSIGPDGSVSLTGAGSVLGLASAALFIWVLLASGAAWIIGAGRTQAAACLDGAGPAILGRISRRSGVPVVMGLVSGGVSLVIMVAYITVTDGDGQKYFSVGLTVAIALIVLAYLLIFPAFVVLRLRRPDLERPFRVPGGIRTAWLVSVVATGWSLLAVVCLLWPGFGTPDPDAALPAGFEGQRATFEMLVLSPIAALLPACAGFYLLGRPSSRRQASSPAVPTSAPVPVELAAASEPLVSEAPVRSGSGVHQRRRIAAADESSSATAGDAPRVRPTAASVAADGDEDPAVRPHAVVGDLSPATGSVTSPAVSGASDVAASHGPA
jgi:hypothetical protein